MTSAAEGGGGFEMLTRGGGRGSKALLTSAKILKFWQNCFKSSVPYTMRETTALIYSPKLTTKFSFKLYKINI